MTYAEYQLYCQNREKIISKNRSNRIKGLPLLQVPDKIMPPKIMVAYESDGTYAGVIQNLDELPDGCHVKMEFAHR